MARRRRQRPPPDRGTVVASGLAVAASVVVFAIELALPDSVAIVVGYPLIVLQTSATRSPRFATAMAGWCTALVLAGMVASPQGAFLHDVANRALALLLLWTAAATVAARGRPLAEQERLARVVEASPDGVVDVDASGRVVSQNGAATALLGVAPDAARGRRLSSLFPPSARDAIDDLVAWRPAGDAVRRLEVTVVHGGEPIPVVVACAQVSGVREELGASVTLRDDRAAKQVEAALRAEARYRGLLDSAPDAIVIVDDHGRVVLVNQRVRELFGHAPEELVGRHVDRLVPDDGRPALRALVQAFFEAPGRRTLGDVDPVVAVDRRGRRFPIEVSLSPIDTDEGVLMAAALRDVTARVEAADALRRARDELEVRVEERTAELSRANADLQAFAYVASHDLKAPLRGIRHLAEWLREDAGDALSEESRKYVGLIDGRAARLQQLVDDLLAYSRAGHGEGPTEDVDVGALVAELVGLLSPPEGITVGPEGPLPVVHTWRAPLQQVLINLVGNAIKHHPGPTGSVRVRAGEVDGALALYVVDDGPGIEEAQRERVFQMFQTLRPRDEVEGSGMGLAIVRKLVERHGGAVWIEDTPGGGATFAFTWPDTPHT